MRSARASQFLTASTIATRSSTATRSARGDGRACTGSTRARSAGSSSNDTHGWWIVAVELADGAVALPRLQAANRRTVILLGHESHGIPEEQVVTADVCVEIPMVGQGASLNVAVAGSLVLYRLAGMA